MHRWVSGPHFLEWGTDPLLYEYTSSLVPHFSDQNYATDNTTNPDQTKYHI